MLKKLFSPFFWHFDRVFGNNKKIGWQIAFITGLAVLVMLFIGIEGDDTLIVKHLKDII